MRTAILVLTIGTLGLGRGVAEAQQAGCTAAPRPPEGVRVRVDKSVPPKGGLPLTPATLTVSWRIADPASTPNAAQLYVIEAGSQTGLSDIGELRTSGLESSLVMPLANGTYFVRLRPVNQCGPGEPSKDERVRVTDSVEPDVPNPLVLLDTVYATRERVGTSAFVRVMGQVRNGWGAAPAAFVSVRASYEGTAGGLGVTQTAFVNGSAGRLANSGLITDTAIEPGGTGCFVLFATFDKPNVTGLGLVAVAGAERATPLEPLVRVSGAPTVAADDFDDLVASGQVTNDGPAATAFNEVWIEARDAAGKVLDCHAAPITPATGTWALTPGETQPFRVVTEAPLSMSRAVRWWASWTAADATAAAPDDYEQRRDALTALLRDTAAAPQEVARARDALRRALQSAEQAAASR